MMLISNIGSHENQIYMRKYWTLSITNIISYIYSSYIGHGSESWNINISKCTCNILFIDNTSSIQLLHNRDYDYKNENAYNAYDIMHHAV